MTIQQKMHNMLVDHLMWDDEATEVIDKAKESEVLSSMVGRWNDDTTDYPPTLLSVVWISVRDCAIEWLQERAPKHIALTMLKATGT